MKISCPQESLSRGLALAGRAAAGRSAPPITRNILLSAKGNRLQLSAANLEIALTAWIDSTVEQEGALTVPARVLADFVNSLNRGWVSIETDPDTHELTISSNGSQAVIKGAPAPDFPPAPPMPEDALRAKTDPATLRKAIGRVAFAAAAEDTRPVLTGVHMKLEEGKFTLAAADGFRLAADQGALTQSAPEDTDVIIPANALNELNRVLSGRRDAVEILLAPPNERITFQVQGTAPVELTARLIKGKFPNYTQLIPEKHSTKAILDAQATLRAMRTTALLARDSTNIIRMELKSSGDGPAKAGKLRISARSQELGEGQDELDLPELEGEETRIAFNCRYLTEALAALSPEPIALQTTTSSSPGVFRPANGDDNYVQVIMPMFVQW